MSYLRSREGRFLAEYRPYYESEWINLGFQYPRKSLRGIGNVSGSRLSIQTKLTLRESQR